MKRLVAAAIIFAALIAVSLVEIAAVGRFAGTMNGYVDRIEDLYGGGEYDECRFCADELYAYFRRNVNCADLFFNEDRIAELELAVLVVRSGASEPDDPDFSAGISALRFAVDEMRRVSGLDPRNLS